MQVYIRPRPMDLSWEIISGPSFNRNHHEKTPWESELVSLRIGLRKRYTELEMECDINFWGSQMRRGNHKNMSKKWQSDIKCT